MSNINMEIKNIKGVKECIFECPLENGIYALVGGNGAGKSTILQALAQLIRPQNALFALRDNDYSDQSKVNFYYERSSDSWISSNLKWKNLIYEDNRKRYAKNNIAINGMYEGSLFVGTRFQDSKQVDDLIKKNEITLDDLVAADKYIIEKLSYILHGDNQHYSSLKRLKNKSLKEKHGLRNLPYFIDSSYGGLISQYRMSSGECLLISLLHFIYNAIIRSSLPKQLPVLMLMDEIELALHPVAVSRFLDLVGEIVEKYSNVVAILTTHAPEVIHKINPLNMYKLENENGIVSIVNPCYPSYAIRELYAHDKYDYLVLCEDDLASMFIDHVINDNHLRKSKLICVLPVGGWENVLKLHIELISKNVVGLGTQIISVLDGDIKSKCDSKKEYKNLVKLYLPIPSIEKYLFEVLYKGKNKEMKKIIGDKYFPLTSIDALIADFNKEHPKLPKQPDKSFYRLLLKDLMSRCTTRDVFIEKLCADIIMNVKIDNFRNQLCAKLK